MLWLTRTGSRTTCKPSPAHKQSDTLTITRPAVGRSISGTKTRTLHNAFEKTLNEHRIQQKNGRPGHPQTQGKIERFHQTLKKWIAAKPPATTISELQRLLDEFADYYNTQRPHRALGRRTPAEVYTTGTKAEPNDNPTEEWRIRNDIVTPNGKVTVRYAGKLYQLGIGRKYAGEPVLMVITDNHITTSLKETGEIITEHYIDTSRNYQKPYWKHGQPPLA